MTPSSPTAESIYSALSDDSDLKIIVELFVEEMPARVSGLLDRLGAEDWEGLRRAAHQLKGAAGSYGFEPITPAAARVEDAIRRSLPNEEIRRSVDKLVALCRRAVAGPPE